MLPVIRDTTQGLWGGGSKERGITSDLFFTTWIWECSTRSPNTGHSRLSHGAALWRVVTRSTPTLQFYSCFRNFCSPHLNPSVKSSHISKQTAINLLLYQIKGYFSFSIVVSPEGRISVIFSSIELLEEKEDRFQRLVRELGTQDGTELKLSKAPWVCLLPRDVVKAAPQAALAILLKVSKRLLSLLRGQQGRRCCYFLAE